MGNLSEVCQATQKNVGPCLSVVCVACDFEFLHGLPPWVKVFFTGESAEVIDSSRSDLIRSTGFRIGPLYVVDDIMFVIPLNATWCKSGTFVICNRIASMPACLDIWLPSGGLSSCRYVQLSHVAKILDMSCIARFCRMALHEQTVGAPTTAWNTWPCHMCSCCSRES